ncbi:uncharacterized protein V6R79_010533 [Siganus canaliculatus]
MAGRSGKRNDPNTVGRFGIGFNSVYHITDVPSILSSRHLGFMDPQEKIFGHREGGFLWSLDDPDDQEALMTKKDQFQPFEDIVSLVSRQDWSDVITGGQEFEGTIFRFPLRNKTSDISDNLYDSDKVDDLFESFIADADLSLLFLKNVTSVSLIHVGADGAVNPRLKVTSSVHTVVSLESEDEFSKGTTSFKFITHNSGDQKETKWLVTTCTMKQGVVEILDALREKLSFFPQVDLAFPCDEARDCKDSRLSCFLPLPNNESNKTGLPVYINACFGLTDNRRHIKWQEEDQKHDEHAVWNELLIAQVLPRAYLMIIQDAIKLAQESALPVSSVYDLWPDIAQVKHRDKWCTVALDVFKHLFTHKVAVLSLAKDERLFVTPTEAVFPCNGPTSPNILDAIRRTLVSRGENLVTLPGSVARAINAAYPQLDTLKYVTPGFLRDSLRRTKLQNLSDDDKLCLLEYVLSDGKYGELEGLQLLPLDDGSFKSFTNREEDVALIDCDEFPRYLLPCCKHLFIPDDLSPACKTHLKELARKKLFKVINIDADRVADYMRRYLPQDWKQTQTGLVTWNTNNSQHPPRDWLQQFWKFLNTHFKELSKFTGMPLIPVSSLSASQPVSLARLEQKTRLISQKSKQVNLPEPIAELVNKVGGTVVKGNEWLRHEDLDSYVLCPSPRSVMKIMVNLDPQDLIRELKTASHSAREQLKDYFSSLDSLSASEKDLLSKLPLFQTMKGMCVAVQSKQAVLQMSGLAVPVEFPMPDSVVQCATEADRRLLQLLKVKLLDTAEVACLLVDCIASKTFRREDTKKIMTWILQHGTVLFSQNQTLKSKCKDLSFIEVNGELKKASSLFDPTIKTFTVIFESDFFPPHAYSQTPEMLKSLRDLGLLSKEVDMSPEHLLHAARLIEQLQKSSKPEAVKRAETFLKMLDTYDLLSKFSLDQLCCLKMLKWIPCDVPHDADSSRNKSTKSFFCPDEIRHSMYKDIVGYVMPLVGHVSDRVAKKFGFNCVPPPEKVKENLFVLASRADKMADPDTNVDFKKKLCSIYGNMQSRIAEFTRIMDKDSRWLWSHNRFVSPQELVLDYPHNLDLSSYIGKVPSEFLPYKKLLLEFGLKISLSDKEIVAILHSIQQTIGKRQQPFANSSEVKVSIEILNWLWREKKTVQDDLPVLVMTGDGQYTLRPLSVAVFCDVSKSGLTELEYSQEEIYVLHEEIPKATAEWLNIRFLSTYILDPELIGIEQCGQSEPITTRIKNILKEYDEESDIFKELIQNAEDAGAEVCKFLVDFRLHKDNPDSLIDPDMALCQGPCLWAFNNEQFTSEDWDNVVRVGSASKENKVEKIGKFGLGFNTVYHVTDIPSILSGNHLLILDPNVTHLTKHIKHKTNPGIKLNLSQQRHFKCFPGQFGPYERVFDCNFTKRPIEPYAGTLIKLPFRTEEEARKSEISTKVYHRDSIINFQSFFTENSHVHLLFLKNINTLSLQNLSKDASTPPRNVEFKTILTVTKTPVHPVRISDEAMVSKQHQAGEALLKLDERCKEVIDSCTASIVQLTNQQSGIAEDMYWLLYNCFGTNQSLKMALQETTQAKFSLPIGGIAAPLQRDPETGKLSPVQTDLVGQSFCFLPLSIHTGLPVNINGTFAVTSNRKGLWETGVKHAWNKALLQDPVVTAYVTVLTVLKNMSENEQLEAYNYHTFWPDREKVSDTFKPLVDAFYSALAQQSSGPELFSDGEHWCSMDNAIFLHESIEEDEYIRTLAMQTCKEYGKPPGCVVPLPLWLRNSLKQAGQEKVLQSRTWDWERFYQEVVFKNLGTMDPKRRDTLVLHAINLNIKEIDQLLVHYPCVPTKSGQLQYIKKLVNPSGKAACLFEADEERLLGGTRNDFCSPRTIQRLLELGMANDHLPLEDIAERAGNLTKTWRLDKKKAYGHLKCLLELMKGHLHDKDSVWWERLRTTAFLPAFSPGDTKMNKNVTLRKPTDIFCDKCALLVNMTCSILDHANLKIHNGDSVLQILGVHESPSLATVELQLQEAYKQSESIDWSTLHKIACECYRFLNQWLIDSGNPSHTAEWANSFPFIFIGSTFVNVNCVAENGQFEAKPYLYVLPPTFTNFKTLWESIGLEKHFTVGQFQTVIKKMHSQYGNKPLPPSDLSICHTILSKGIFEAKEKVPDDCLIPNIHGVLQPASEMFYNDSPWMPVASGITLCHGNIPRPMARHFGIKTTRHHTLQSHVVENMSPFAFQFEQKEQLTVRIKNIISAYPAKKDIVKELLQNADDAEATEIHFVWDKRQHGKQKTFGKKWNHLQGPALCVFNNKVFSEADLKGIQQLGEGGKHNSAGKTGKYGVGFNSVYHLTDCPSILTGDKYLCISDPNQKYIESHEDQSPSGMGYELAEPFKNMYMDVYKSFLPDEFALEEGTMFRLPLRTEAMANSSKISTQSVTEQHMRELCSVLSQDPEGLILFLKNICKIHVHEIDDKSQTLKTIFVVEKSATEANREEKDTFEKRRQNALQSDEPAAPCQVIYEATISSSDKRKSTWIIAEQFGSDTSSSEEEAALPQAAVAARLSIKPPLSLHSPPSSFVQFKGGAFCSLPLPGETGLPVHINGNFEVDSARRGLWKQDGQSQKSNWNTFLKQNVIAPLYADLLYYIRMHHVKNKKMYSMHIESHLSVYLDFWPVVTEHVQEWHEMIHWVYKSISGRGLCVIPVLRSSTRVSGERVIKEYFFDWCDVRETDSIKAPHLTQQGSATINPILEDLGMTLVPLTTKMESIWKSFRCADVKVKDVNPVTVQTFLRSKPLNDPTQTNKKDLPLPITATLIIDEERCSKLLSFCLEDFDKGFKKEKSPTQATSLNGLPLLLTRDKNLRVFHSQSPKFISLYEGLFHFSHDEFADYRTNGSHTDVLQAFNLIKPLTVPCAAKYLKPVIQLLLQQCEVDPHSGLHIPNEETTKWLKLLWRYFASQIKRVMSGDDKNGLTLSDVKQLFGESCILPVLCPRLKNKHFLQAMKDMASVIHFHKETDISPILFKLGFLKLDSTFFDTQADQQHVHSLLHPELMDVNDKSSVLDQVHKINHSEFSKLSPDEMTELQKFLQDGVDKAKDKQDYVRKLKSMPLFETVNGNRVKIDGPCEVFILNSMLSTIFPDLFTLSANSKSILLRNNVENLSLALILNIQSLTDLEYFMKFILPVIHTLNETQLLQCLKLLLSPETGFTYSEQKDKIISDLKTVKLIRNSKGKLEMASFYYDENVELYKKMLPQERFVPEKFWTELCKGDLAKKMASKSLLRDLGMKHTVSKKEIIQFANQLESEAKGNSQFEELKKKSSLIFKKALDIITHGEDKEENLLASIANIKFIFPQKIQPALLEYHQAFASERTAVTLRGSLIKSDPNHQDLIWSSMPIIDLPYKNSHLLKMMKNVGVHEEPPLSHVTNNMTNICQSPCKNEKLIQTRARVFRSSYAYLQAKKFEGQTLAGHPVVLVEKDTVLVRTDDVCLSLPHDLEFRPYLYKISEDDAIYIPFFRRIGVNEKPTVKQYCNVLAAIHDESQDKQELNPNQMKAVKRAVQQFFRLIRAPGNQSLVEDVETLYLPAVDGKLYPSCSLYYNDTVCEIKRLEEALENKFLLLEKLSDCHLGSDRYEHHQLVKLLPQKLQLKMLSEVTEERVEKAHMESCEFETDCEFSGWFERHLSSAELRHGLICVIRDQSEGKITHEDAAEMCDKIFGSIQIVCCKNLETKLWLQNQPLEKTVIETNVFVQRTDQECIFYLKHHDGTAPKVINGINVTLSKEINALLDNKLEAIHLLVLGELLMCDSLEEVKRILAKNEIQDSTEVEDSHLSPPRPGTDIPEEWYDALDMDVFNNFEVGEYVGYDIDGKYVFAVIVEELPGHSGAYSWRYKIDIGEEEPIEVMSIDLFQFKRQMRRRAQTHSLEAEASSMEVALLAGAVPHSSRPSTSAPVSLDEAKRQIDKRLAEIWTLPEEQRQRAIHRLYLKWHPDKNPDCEFVATEAFKYLKNQITELRQGNSRSNNNSSRRSGSRRSSSRGPSWNYSNFSNFFHQWDEEARQHRSSWERSSRSRRNYNYWAHSQNVPRPNQQEAERWCRQARCDLNAASKDTDGGSTEWCLFKIHQAVEKSLMAAEFKRRGERSVNSSISALAVKVSSYSGQLRDLPQIVAQLKALGVDAQRTQYPNYHRMPHIPNEQFEPESAVLALDMAEELLSKIEAYVN